jgi:hypothetical protein
MKRKGSKGPGFKILNVEGGTRNAVLTTFYSPLSALRSLNPQILEPFAANLL